VCEEEARFDEALVRRGGPPLHRARGEQVTGVSCPTARNHPEHSAEAPGPVGRSDHRGCRLGPLGRAQAVPAAPAEAGVPGHGRSRGRLLAWRPHPPRRADARVRRNLTKQPTSRLCSADESVVTSRRCQRPATRSFHGLCVPLQGPARPRSDPAMPDRPAPRRHAEARLRDAWARSRDSKLSRTRAVETPPSVHPVRRHRGGAGADGARGRSLVSTDAFSAPCRDPLAAPEASSAT